ncbi:MAG: 4Fe-4S dicluster domain-containing protein [Methermicoccaceae archaeon]
METEELDANFKYEVMNEPGGEDISMCFSCTGCTVSCPVSEIRPEYNPRRFIHDVLLGMRERVLSDPALWLCVQCHSCYETCPQNVHVTEVMGALKSIAVRESEAGALKLDTRLPTFDESFTRSIERYGKPYESMVFMMHILKTEGLRGLLDYAPVGMKMFFKGKLHLLSHTIARTDQIRAIFESTHHRGGEE